MRWRFLLLRRKPPEPPEFSADDIATPDREALAEATRHDEFEPPEVSDNSHAKLFFVFIAIVMAFAFIFTPGHS